MKGLYLDKHNRMFLDTKDYFVKQISHLSKGVVIVASADLYTGDTRKNRLDWFWLGGKFDTLVFLQRGHINTINLHL